MKEKKKPSAFSVLMGYAGGHKVLTIFVAYSVRSKRHGDRPPNAYSCRSKQDPCAV